MRSRAVSRGGPSWSLLVALVLIAAVLLMHALPAVAGSANHGMVAAEVTVGHTAPGPVASPWPASGDAVASAVGHVMNHPCLAVLTAALTLLLLIGALRTPRVELNASSPPAGVLPGRDPPWTTPTLPELSILRV
ncbi:MAG: DUF6153 family protein [Mycobacteriaceae bacterium]